ncbi:MAG: OmpW family outer membrane protein [Gammaproteobacteria bacterium]
MIHQRTLTTPTTSGNRRLAQRLAGIALTLSALTANADINKSGAYATVIGGVNTLGDQDIEATIGGISGSGTTSFSASYIAGFSIGYRFANNWSIEEEFVFRRTALDSATLTSLGTFSDGGFENTQLTAKALYHLPLRSNNDIEMYVGAGIAWLAELDFDFETAEGEQPFEKDRFGVEFHAGVRYHGWKHGFAGAGVRYLAVNDAVLPSPSNAGDTVRLGYDPLSVVFELGWRF